jgi:hypothetical protein
MTDWPNNLIEMQELLENNYNIKLLYDDLLDQGEVLKKFNNNNNNVFDFVVMILCYHYPDADAILKARFGQGRIKNILDKTDYSAVVKIQQLIDQDQ